MLRKYRRTLLVAALAFVIYLGVALFLTYPLVTDMGSYYFNPGTPHDGVGTIADVWFTDYAHETGLRTDYTRFYGYPFGVDRKGVPYPLTNGLMTQFARIIGAQASYNLLVIFSFPLAGILMFVLLFYLTGSNLASFAGGFLYAFSPWHTARTFDQVSLAGIHCLPLFLLAFIVFWKKRTVLSAIALAVAWIIAIFTDYHLGFFCALIPFTWALASWYQHRKEGNKLSWASLRESKQTVIKVALLALLIIVVVGAVTLPVTRWLFYEDPQVFPGGEQRGIEETVAFSARPWFYVIPPTDSLLWKGFTNDFVAKRMGRQGTHEVTCYPGIVTCCLAAFAIVYLFRRKKYEKAGARGEEPNLEGGRGRVDGNGRSRIMDTATYFGIITAVAAFILSMPPLVKVGGVEIPTPSIIMRALAPPFRFYSRWAVMVTLAICLLAGIGFARLLKLRSWKSWKSVAACIVLIALFWVDVTIVPPFRSKDISRPPDVIKVLAGTPHSEPVCFYPLKPGWYQIPLWYRYYQQFHLHPMMNGAKAATEADLYSMVLKDIYSPYTPRMLEALGIEQAVVLSEYFDAVVPGKGSFDPQSMPEGYSLESRTDDGYIFDVDAEPAQVFPLFYTNFTSSRYQEDGRAWTVLQRPVGEILLINEGGDSSYDFSVNFVNPGKKSIMRIKLDGKDQAGIVMGEGAGRLDIPDLRLTKERHILTLEWGGEPVEIYGEAFGVYDTLPVYLLFSQPTIE